MDFIEFPKMARLSRECIITEKIDGTNAQVYITEDGKIYFGSRTRWITPDNDNYGFAAWGMEHRDELMKLGPGRHFGEWWGSGIQRKYDMKGKQFSLFNVTRWDNDERPSCCLVVPTLYRGVFDTAAVMECLRGLESSGSKAAPGFMQPEGIVVYHVAAGIGFKKTIDRDEEPKSKHNNR